MLTEVFTLNKLKVMRKIYKTKNKSVGLKIIIKIIFNLMNSYYKWRHVLLF